ncbi:Ldh family oxidoreductase [Lentilactobacillus parafarraginis]|jgi:LDH2 family malate/lactate/ureidoglycolate dehydrogenase|uniref:Malate L-lactate dehydrogenase n=2 Tax=Lentilactobacillus parafarraginis TaxID=390842 RepID=A0A0R1YPR7_9LACO|nr:malate L-lactate dehydrogenase [Lentilactobacillus parafarraginis DSM 18390 = JCM 14109]TLQ21241.1 Ldh family oxidoreductase [Lentilactobacillus parafarraginis]
MGKEVAAVKIAAATVKNFIAHVYLGYGFSETDSALIAETLTDADLRGITSHGIQRLAMYDRKIRAKAIIPYNKWTVVRHTKSSLLVDANHTMGQLVSAFTMDHVVSKAQRHGISVGVVRHSNHFGAAGYYARMAAKAGLIGIVATNTNPLLVPPRANQPFLGSNPLAFAFPTQNAPFVFDAATSTVSLGKIEVLLKNNQSIPGEWAVNGDRQTQTDPQTVLDELARSRRIGGILPLGGQREANANYKGFGNSLIVECLTGILAQGSISADLGHKNHDISHFFLALDPELFGDPQEIEASLSDMLDRIRHLAHSGANPIRVPGDREIQNIDCNLKNGVVIDQTTIDQANEIANRLGISDRLSGTPIKE